MDQSNQQKPDVRCPVCLKEFNQANLQHAGVKSCPFCKTSLQWLDIAHDGYIHINWQNLRVLAIYAQRWANMWDMSKPGNMHALQALENIFKHLAQYQPASSPPLLLQQDARIGNNTMVGKITITRKKMALEESFDPITSERLKPDASGKILSPFFKSKTI